MSICFSFAVLKQEQLSFAFETIGISRQRAVRADNTVTGNDNGYWIGSHSTTHRLCRLAVDTTSDVTICHRLSIRDGRKFIPHAPLEQCTQGCHLRSEIWFFSVEITIEPTTSLFQYRDIC